MFSRNLWGYDFTPGTYHYARVNDPLGWRKPRRVFVCSMGDLFHEAVEDWMLERVLDRVCYDGISNHTFMLLTKRPERMAQCFADFPCPDNVWLGVTAENQERADERIPILLQIPAAVHWVSVEPMLGPVDLNAIPFGIIHKTPGKPEPNRISALRNLTHFFDEGCVDTHGLEWVVAGPETGPGARRCDWQWIEDLHEQCKAAGVAFYDKRNVSPLAREYPR
jgi:protein gp37